MEIIKWDGVAELDRILEALLSILLGGDKDQALRMSYGDFGHWLKMKHRDSGSFVGGRHIDCDSSGVQILFPDSDIAYRITWNKAAKALHKYINDKEVTMIEPQIKTPPADVSSAVTDKYTEAYNLNVRIITSAQAAQMSLLEFCKGLDDMRKSKLYRELGYNNYADYCSQELGITRRQGEKYAAIASILTIENAKSTSHIEQLGMEKLYLLTRIEEDARIELSNNVDLESISVRELKEEITKLKKENDENVAEIERQKDLRRQTIDRVKSLAADKNQLEDRVKELESKPVDVAVVDNSQELRQLREKLAETEAKLAEKPAVQTALPELTGTETEIAAYQKVAENSLHNLYTAVLRQKKYEHSHFTKSVNDMLERYRILFEFKEEM